eukprot:CAMPEP_0179455358 /NCGR_PEP_ID=MMETSP0799-20121207/39340_1 /TAXON_ID=46947 /ORGANISM="Geminigera cryophila, Strain CCMP2564" /LENGTH=90 /DNA_ID=CAMNT_0021254393 /DNA_START=139 /DNA_END=411 /DNA_ORIENTATION=+
MTPSSRPNEEGWLLGSEKRGHSTHGILHRSARPASVMLRLSLYLSTCKRRKKTAIAAAPPSANCVFISPSSCSPRHCRATASIALSLTGE